MTTASPRAPRVGGTPANRLGDARHFRDRLRSFLEVEGMGGRALLTLVPGGFGVLVKYPAGLPLPPDRPDHSVPLSFQHQGESTCRSIS